MCCCCCCCYAIIDKKIKLKENFSSLHSYSCIVQRIQLWYTQHTHTHQLYKWNYIRRHLKSNDIVRETRSIIHVFTNNSHLVQTLKPHISTPIQNPRQINYHCLDAYIQRDFIYINITYWFCVSMVFFRYSRSSGWIGISECNETIEILS